MNRRVGKAAILKEQQRRAMLAERGAKLNAEKLEQLRAQMRLFETHLRQFAMNHKESIQNDPAFRAQFHKMCASIGVDPLTSRKGMWSDVLGVGDYYYELAVRTVEICVATRHLNGGVLALDELLRSLRRKRAVYAERISEYFALFFARAYAKSGIEVLVFFFFFRFCERFPSRARVQRGC